VTIAPKARKDFLDEHACSQAVFMQFAQQMGLPENLAARIAAGFGGGMGQAETCGALTGAYMVLGLRYSDRNGIMPEDRETVTGMIQIFNERFIAKHGSLTCRGLLQCDISTEDGKQHAETQGLRESICADLVQSSVEILEDLV
jgi:C_GCAxxG_C_C family probable redox protein